MASALGFKPTSDLAVKVAAILYIHS